MYQSSPSTMLPPSQVSAMALASLLAAPASHMSSSPSPGIVMPTSVESTIYVADLPLSTTYKDVHNCFDSAIGPCDVVIKR